MPTYIYKAIDSKGNISNGEVTLQTKQKLIDYLVTHGLTPVSVNTKGEARKKKTGLFQKKITSVDKVLLTKHLAAIINTGLELRDAINILIAEQKKPMMKEVLFHLRDNLEKGQPMSATFEYYKEDFSPIFVGMIKSGEISGNLGDSLDKLSLYLSKEDETRKKIVSALIYPAMIFFAIVGIAVLLLTFVLPKLVTIFAQTGIKLPFMLRGMMFLSNILTYNGFLTAGVFLAVIIFFGKTKPGKKIVAKVITKIPLMGEMMRKMVLGRMCRTLSVLLTSGMPIIETLNTVAGTVGSEEYRLALLKFQRDVKKGINLSSVFSQRAELFPGLFLGMVAIGEKSGTLGKTLETAANFYEEEAEWILKGMITALEPALLIIMGIVVGGVAISVLGPIYQLIGSF